MDNFLNNLVNKLNTDIKLLNRKYHLASTDVQASFIKGEITALVRTIDIINLMLNEKKFKKRKK